MRNSGCRKTVVMREYKKESERFRYQYVKCVFYLIMICIVRVPVFRRAYIYTMCIRKSLERKMKAS